MHGIATRQSAHRPPAFGATVRRCGASPWQHATERRGISRDAFLDAMNQRRIGTGVNYLAIPEHPYYQQRYGWKPGQWPNATRIGRQAVSLPLSPKLTRADVERVIGAVVEDLMPHAGSGAHT